MKNNLLKKILIMSRYMILGVLLQCVFYSFMLAEDTNAQVNKLEDIHVNLNLDGTVEDVFMEIENATDFKFSYNVTRLDLRKNVNLIAYNGSLSDALLSISMQTDFKFKRINNVIFVSKLKKGDDEDAVVQEFQSHTITGKVTSDENPDGLPGVNVIVKGTTQGTVTDIGGNYSIEVPSSQTVLVFSSVGFVTEEVVVGDRSVIDIMMVPDVTSLEEIVVVGYGEVEADDVTGAISTLKEKDFNVGVISSPEQLIQGRTSGVQITTNSGEPGGGISMRVRGTGSVRQGNNPLFVVDGVPISGDAIGASGQSGGLGTSSPRNPLNFLNPDDIESITVLKDASAAAIYGARGANGVVIITTKKGSGDGEISYSFSLAFSDITKKYDVMNAEEFLIAYDRVGGADPDIDQQSDTDWQDQIFRTGVSQNHSLSFGGSNEKSDYRFSLGYSDQQGIVKENGMKRFTGRFNGSRKFLKDRLQFTTQMTIANIEDDHSLITDDASHQGDLLAAAIKTNPTWPIYNADGTHYQPDRDNPNPVAMIDLSKDFSNTLKFLGSFGLDLKITEWLSYKTVIGLDNSISKRQTAYSRDLVSPGVDENNGIAYISDVISKDLLWENLFVFNKDFEWLNLDAVLGYSYQKFDRSGQTATAMDFRTSDLDLMLNNLTSANLSAITDSYKNVDELQSYFGRVNLSVKDKYLITATVRADGSTKFSENNTYGVFPSFAMKWRISEESFSPSVFSDLNVRAGWGITGNQEIPHNLYTRRQRYGSPSFDLAAGTVNPGALYTVAFENENLKWEETEQLSIGLEFGFIENRLRGSFEYYNRVTTDLLMRLDAAEPAPQDYVWKNLDAEVVNTGFEVDLTFDAIVNDDFRWTILANASFNENTIRDYDYGYIETGSIQGQGLSGTRVQRIENGHTIYAYYLPEFSGFDDSGNAIISGEAGYTGDYPVPSTIAGFTNDFSYKNFDLSIFFAGQFGHSIYSNTANAYFSAPSLSSGRNVSREVGFSEEVNTSPINISTRYLEKADFVRLQNLSLGYTIRPENSVLSSLRFSITGQNLLTFTGYSGQDPEVNINKPVNDIPSFGIDYTPYPRARTFLFGLDVIF